MNLKVSFSEQAQDFTAKMQDVGQAFQAEFKDVSVIERVDIPSRYGLVTYDHTKTITVS